MRAACPKFLLASLALGILLPNAGCLLPPEDTTPMPAIWKFRDLESRSQNLIVFLPGRHYRRTFSERVLSDVIGPARSRGYRTIWAVGVSLGGFGAIMFERDHPGTWDGVVLIAPFAGDQKDVLQRIHDAPSLQAVSFSPGRTDDDYTENFWHWLQQYQRNPAFPILLGYGEQDRMQADQAIIAGILPAGTVVTIPGKHEWSVWRELWEALALQIRIMEDQ